MESSKYVDFVFEALFISLSANEVALAKGFFLGGVHLDPTDPPELPTSSLEAEGDRLESSDDISEEILGLEWELENDLRVLELVLARVLIRLESFRDLRLLACVDGLRSSSPSSLTSLTVGTGYGPEYVDGVGSVCPEEASSWTNSGTGGIVGLAAGFGRVNNGTE